MSSVDDARGPDFPTGGIIVDDRASIVEAYQTGRGGFRVRARWQQEDQGRGTWTDRRHRNPLSGAEGRLIEQIAELLDRAQAAAARGRPRRKRRGHPPRAGAEEPHGRSRPADGIAVQARPSSRPLPAQHERAVARQGAERDVAQAGAAGVAGAPQRRAGAPLAPPARRDRAPAGDARRLSDRLSQPRRGDPHHPRGGRAEAGDDGALR